jgi:glycosyltransferase involved in cell wall biosynthesis
MGKALVASNIGGHKELIEHGHNGLLFPPGNISSLIEAIESLLDNDELRLNLEKQGVSMAREAYSWERTTANYFDLYAGVLDINPSIKFHK